MKYLVRTLVILMFFTHFGWCQSDGFITLPLQDLSSFQEQSGNWFIVGDVLMDPEVSVHHPPDLAESKKKKKKRKREQSTPIAVNYTAGSGILLNMNNEEMKDALLTKWEHADIDISFEVMLPKGSNSGIYLQGRYEVQLYDSWGVMRPKFSDIGGIYRNWESETGKIYMGKAPLSNPSKAPGLWQKLDISFRAPKFDQAGNKIANAKLVFVDLNGVRIHENVEIPLPTGGPVENNEKPTGPLMIQGDHGPVAIRNFKYRSLKGLEVKIDELQYEVFHGSFKNLEDLTGQEAVLQGKADGLTCTIAGVPDKFALVYSGTLVIPEKDEYQFDLAYTGGAFMTVNGQEVINYQRPDGWWRRDKGSLHLDSGTHSWELTYFKEAEWMPPRLAFSVSTSQTYPTNLHDFDSYPPSEDPVADILVHAGNEVKLLRAFLDYQGDKSQRLTHTIGVSEPRGVNYVYDLDRGNLVCVWRGDFVDATPMWHNRGDGSFRPLGGTQYIMNAQPLFLAAESSGPELKSTGYQLEENGRPIFTYSYGNHKIKDRLYPDETNTFVTREISLENPTAGLFFKIAQGSNIISLGDGRYVVDDKSYYIKIHLGEAEIRDGQTMKELVAPLHDQSLVYSIIW